jgi:cation:H+ antiporter
LFTAALTPGTIPTAAGNANTHTQGGHPGAGDCFGRPIDGQLEQGNGNPRMMLLLFFPGLAALVAGAQVLVRGASKLALSFGISPLVVGLTVVAFGTSAPELAVSLRSSFAGQVDIALGNVIGSNTFNLLGVLGLSGLLAPAGLPVTAAMIVFDLPVMIAVALACLPIFFSGHLIARWEGALFLTYYVAYTAYLLLAAQQHAATAAYGSVILGFALPLTAATLSVVAWREWRARQGSP